MRRMILKAALAVLPGIAWAGPVDLNAADAETIARELSGVGAARAQAIIDYREEFGRFESVEELLNVSGIGESILDRNRDNIIVTPR